MGALDADLPLRSWSSHSNLSEKMNAVSIHLQTSSRMAVSLKKKKLNISIVNCASYRSMIYPACFTIPGYITFNLIQTKEPTELMDSAVWWIQGMTFIRFSGHLACLHRTKVYLNIMDFCQELHDSQISLAALFIHNKIQLVYFCWKWSNHMKVGSLMWTLQ